MAGKWSGGFEYNLTTQSEFQQIKLQNKALKQENQALKKSLGDLISINNELTESMESINSIALTQYLSQGQQNYKIPSSNNNQVEQQMLMNEREIQYIVQALQKLVDSFNQIQHLYDRQIQTLSNDIESERKQCTQKLKDIEEKHISMLKNSQELINYLKRKEEIIHIVEKKLTYSREKEKEKQKANGNTSESIENNESNKVNVQNLNSNHRRLLKKHSEMETVSQRKQSKSDFSIYEAEIAELKNKQKKLSQEIVEKDKTILVYNELLSKLRKKLLQKY